MRSSFAHDKDIANHDNRFSRQKAAKRPQNVGPKATVAKRPHFAHGGPTHCVYGSSTITELEV